MPSRSASLATELASVALREVVTNAALLILSVTVLPATPWRSRRRASSAATGASRAASASAPRSSRLNVRSTPTDFRTRWDRTGRSSWHRATRASHRPVLPSWASRASASQDWRSAPVSMPSRRSRFAVAGPTPWMSSTASAATTAGAWSGVITCRPSGLARPDAVLARNFPNETPALAVSPVSCWISARIAWATSVPDAGPVRGSVTSR